MHQVKNGNLELAGSLYDLYNVRIYNFFLRSCFDPALSKDMTQNVFLRMIRYRSSYNPDKPFKAWIYQVSRNILRDTMREKNRTVNEDLSVITEMPEEGRIQEEQLAILNNSLKRLNEEDRQLLVFSKYENMKYEEIASIMNISVANVKVKVHRAIRKLREHYFELEQD